MSTMTPEKLECILEAAILASEQALTISQMQKLFADDEVPTTQEMRAALHSLEQRYTDRGIELKETSSGYQFQSRTEFSPWLSRLWEEKPPRYSRAFMETLAIIAYRQPVTRAEIEDIRGVGVSQSIFKTLLERDWIRLVGYKDIPGKPAIYGTTKTFLDYFNIKSLRDLPALVEAQSVTALDDNSPVQLAFDNTLQAGVLELIKAADQMAAEESEEAAEIVDSPEVSENSETIESMEEIQTLEVVEVLSEESEPEEESLAG